MISFKRLSAVGTWVRLLYWKRAFWFRAFLCWGFGLLILSGDEINSYDLRFQLRGDQPISSDIVLITIRGSEVITLFENTALNEGALNQGDRFFWDQKLWSQVLKKVLTQNPRKVGITFFFGDNIGPLLLSRFEQSLFLDDRVIWAANLYNREIPIMPPFIEEGRVNAGIGDWFADEDGVIRRFGSPSVEIPHLALQLADSAESTRNVFLTQSQIINFRGTPGLFPEYRLSELLLDKISPTALQDKIVIIGAELNSGASVITPVGPMSRAELLANVVDNLVQDRWIKRLPQLGYWFGLFLVMLLAVSIISTYPQSVALFLMLWFALLVSALSAWIFDSAYIWVPVLSPIVTLVFVWVVFVGYQATKMEKRTWQLQQERTALQELEQLKNNFVSLISHDLKTPIAKIQGAIDRINTQAPPTELSDDLLSIRNSSDELHRYIQSILKVLRVESRDFKIHKEVSDINELVEEVLLQVAPLADEKEISIEKSLEPLFSIEFDITLIKEVILNIIENAIKYTPAKGSIKITTQETDTDIELKVSDTGEGIGPDELQNVWRKFVRGKGQDLKTKGTGLGLYLVKYFIELHGGSVAIESKVQKGTTVTVKLPLESNENEEGSAT
ncbi:MAG: ATP-binding protein [Pseudobdellovibrionaceae bacterium]